MAWLLLPLWPRSLEKQAWHAGNGRSWSRWHQQKQCEHACICMRVFLLAFETGIARRTLCLGVCKLGEMWEWWRVYRERKLVVGSNCLSVVWTVDYLKLVLALQLVHMSYCQIVAWVFYLLFFKSECHYFIKMFVFLWFATFCLVNLLLLV